MPLHTLVRLHAQCSYALWEIDAAIPTTQLPQADQIALDCIAQTPKKAQSSAARLAAQAILQDWGIEYRGIAKNEYKQPLLLGGDFGISLSHTPRYAAALIHQSARVGLDLEMPREQLLRVARRVLDEAEWAFAQHNLPALTLLWSGKEALYKYHGTRGLTFVRDMHIHPFVVKSSGQMHAILQPQGTVPQVLTLHYHQYGDIYMVYVLGERTSKPYQVDFL